MSKKTFFSILWLMAGCGVLALAAFVITTRQQNHNATAIWTTNADTSSLQQLVFEADGKTLISVGGDIRKWDVPTGKLKSRLPKKGNSWLRYSPDGKYYAYGTLKYFTRRDFSYTVYLHDARNSALLQTFVFPKGNEQTFVSIDEIVFSNQGKLLNINYLLRHERPKGRGFIITEIYTVWDTRTKKQIRSHSRKVTEDTRRNYYQDPFFSPDGRQLWLLESAPITDATPLIKLPSSPYYRYYRAEVKLNDLLRNKTVGSYKPAQDRNNLLFGNWDFACASPEGSLIAAINNSSGVGSSNGTLFVFNLHTQKVLWRRDANNLDTQALAFSPDGRFLAWGGRDFNRPYAPSYAGSGKLLLLDSRTGKVVTEITERTWIDTSKQEQISKVEAFKGVFGVNPEGSNTPRYLPGDSGTVECLTFSPDGKMLAVGYSSGLLKLWRVPQE